MIELSVTDFQARMNQILNQVERGEEVIITRQGKAIAKLSTIIPIHYEDTLIRLICG